MDDSIGQYMARQRQLRGITVDELAEATRIPRRSLERLEAGAFDANPDGFVRGFVRTVAEALGLDPADTLNRMLPEPQGGADRPAGRAAAVALLGLGTLLLIVLGSLVWMRAVAPEPAPAAASASSDPELVYRRDYVRSLAESVAPGGD